MNEIIILADLEVGGQRGRVHSPDGIIAALSATDYKDPPKVLVEIAGTKRHKGRGMDVDGKETGG